MLIGIATPYRKGGLLYRKYSEHFGKDTDECAGDPGAVNRAKPNS